MKPARMKPIGVPKTFTLEQSASIKIYLQEIKNYRTLTRSEELDYLVRAKEGDTVAIEKIVKHNLKFVVSVAKRYQHGYGYMLLVDLIQLGNIGLIRAIGMYKMDSGVKFFTYAVWWIRQSIMNEMDRYNAPIDFPHNFYSTSAKIREYRSKFEQEHGYEPTTEDLEEIVRPADKKVLRYGEMYTNRFVYLDKVMSPEPGHESTFGEVIEDENAEAPDAGLAANDTKIVVARLLRALNPLEKQVMTSYYGIDGQTALNTDEIAEKIGKTSVRVRQIMTRAQVKMKDTADFLKYNPNN